MVRDVDIIFTLVHKIDREKEHAEIEERSNGDLKDYIAGLMMDILENKNYKYYKKRETTSEVLDIVNDCVENECLNSKKRDHIANRYLYNEKMGQERIDRMNGEVKKGFLIQALLYKNEKYYYFISKVEINPFLETEDMIKRKGMPYGDKTLKTCLFLFDYNKEIENIYISDKQNAKYWYYDFLELDECTSDEKATKDLYVLIERKIKDNTRKSKQDYYALSNALATYFQSPRRFNYDEMEKVVFKDYKPDNPEVVDIKKISTQIQEKIKIGKYDTEFMIVPKIIQKNLKKNIKVNTFVNLQLDGGDENYKTIITAFKEKDKKYLKIETDNEAFEIFYRA